jgi:hypothetical protein
LLLATSAAGFVGLAGAQAEELPAEASTTTSTAVPPTTTTSTPPPPTTPTTSVTVGPPTTDPAADVAEPSAAEGDAAAGSGSFGAQGAGGGFGIQSLEGTTTTLTAPVSNWWATDFDLQIQVDQSSGPTAPTGTVDISRRLQGEISFVLIATVPVADDGTDLVTPDSAATYTETEDVEAGVYEYLAEYSGEPALVEPAIWYDASSSFVEATTINEAPVTVTWVGAPPNPRDGQPFPLRVRVERAAYAGPGPVPTGFVVFDENGSTTGVIGVDPDGTATDYIGGRPEGLYDYTAYYAGSGFDAQYSASGVIQRDVTVLPAGLGEQLETTTIMAPPGGATFPYGTDMPITIFVTNTNGVPNVRPSGNVDIYRSDDDGGTWTLVDTEPLVDIDPPNPSDPAPAGWVYWEETEDLAPGVYDYYADYAGEPVPADVDTSWFAPSTSGQVNSGNGMTVTLGSTEITLGSDITSAPEGSTFTLIPTVTNGGNPVTTGTVRYFLGDQWIADQPAATPNLEVVPPIGYHRFYAEYVSDGVIPGATTPFFHTLISTGPLPSDVVLSWPEGLTYGDDIELTAEVFELDIIPNGVRDGPTGTVEFFDGVYGSLGTATIVFIPAEDEGPGRYVATLTVTRDLPPGDREIWAVYNGEASHPTGFPFEATGTPASVLPVQGGTVDVQLGVTSTELEGEDGGACVTLLATVTPTVGSAPVDGTITYSIDGSESDPPDDDAPQCTRVVPPVGNAFAIADIFGAELGGADLGGAWTSTPVPVGTPFTTWIEDGPHDFGAAFGGDSGYGATSVSSPGTIGEPPVDPPPVDPPPVDPGGPGVPPLTPSTPPGGPNDPSSPSDGGTGTVVLADATLAAVATEGAVAVVEADEGAPDQGPVVDEVALGIEVPKDSDSISSRFDVQRSLLADSIPTRHQVDWSLGAIAGAVWMALLLILLVELPSSLVNATIEDHHDRVMKPFAGVIGWAAAVDTKIARWPTALVLLTFAALSGVIGAQLDPGFGIDASSLTLLAALICSFVIITVVLEGMRLPYLRARTGKDGRLKLFPFVLVMAVVAVVVCRIFDFQPGYVFGVSVALLLSEGIEEEDEARSLAISGVVLLLVAGVAWFVWNPIADRAMLPDAGVVTIFFDALLSTTWVMALQVILFEFSSMRGMHGRTLRRWNRWVWGAIYFGGAFLLVKMVLHPSAWRWGGLPQGTFVGMIALFGVLMVAAVIFWAWFNLRAAADDETPHDLDDDRMTDEGLVS